MKVNVPPGRYILAVSGGVDSMVLLDLLSQNSGVELIVAHFNHGIRKDADKDERLVKNKAKEYGLSFEVGFGNLGKNTSEDAARKARYSFLLDLKEKYKANSVITAHHQDDLVETAIINLLRGTGRRGLISITTNKKVTRPLIHHAKKELLAYAKTNNIKWHEDSTNQDESYLRNYVRRQIIPKLSIERREKIIEDITRVSEIDDLIEPQIAKLSHQISNNSEINRHKFAALPVELGNEVIIHLLKAKNLEYDAKTVNRVNMILRTSKAGTRHPVKDDLVITFEDKSARFAYSL